MAGKVAGVVTAPVNKALLSIIYGSTFSGQTEFLARVTRTNQFMMVFFCPGWRVALLSTHLPLSKALHLVRRERIEAAVKFLDRSLEQYLGVRPRLVVCALNPHGGEEGMFGSEERDELEPALETCREAGIDVDGPFPADVVFHRDRRRYDAVLALFHDQALIPVRALGFGKAVNVTLGLPFPRTSPDHGTAYDLAGTGRAGENGMVRAIRLCRAFARMESRSKV